MVDTLQLVPPQPGITSHPERSQADHSEHTTLNCHSERSEESPHFALRPALDFSAAPEPRHSLQAGFTLLELLIVMTIIAVLAAMAIPAYVRNVEAAKEAVLREDLQVMRTAIGSYTVDKQKAPQSLDDLVSAGYIKAVPADPLTRRTDSWVTAQSDTLSSIDQTDGGIDDVHSGAQVTGLDGTATNTW